MLAVRAMVLDSPGSPLREAELPDPEPGALDLAGSQPVRYPRTVRRKALFLPMAAIETLETERLVALVLSEAERDALVRALYVVKDNFWLDDVEESLLERLLERGES